MFAGIFVNIVGPLRVLSLGVQAEDNDPIKALRRIKEFHSFHTANFDTFKENCKTMDEHDNTQPSYKGVVLKNYPRAFNGSAKQRGVDKRNHFSLHFIGKQGPTEENPNPLSATASAETV